ncbi:unnamed protein product [Peronospora farinosa]|uniref:Uncharacterized protein n=1 Tax=Peronospora farinosa TaxID=134698 RepID=A0AAV0U455_9STRA|nr:unnamed protein product [Peronospora farinosa]CAH0493925.1 unnamed protein product [Peronospora farinosa]CAI5731690.1 unnamed protein product [Peronospora farinosa]
MAKETTPLRGEQFVSDAQKRKRIIGITGAVVVIASIIIVLWLTLSGHSTKSTVVTVKTTNEPTPAVRTETSTAPLVEVPINAPVEFKAASEQLLAESTVPVNQ